MSENTENCEQIAGELAEMACLVDNYHGAICVLADAASLGLSIDHAFMEDILNILSDQT